MEASRVIEAARSHIGTRYRDRSQQAGVSLDCYGLLAVTAAEVGAFLPPMGDHVRPSLEYVLEGLDGPLARLDGPVPGALVVIAPGQASAARPRLHFGVLTDDAFHSPYGLVHVTREAGAVVEECWGTTWQRATRGFFALRGGE